jgi:hypothetical protein
MKKLLIVLSLLVFPAAAQANWISLGTRTVEHTADKDTFHVSHAGGLKGLMMNVKHNDITVNKFQVIYANGEKNWVRTARTIRAGGSTGYIDLPGNRRVVKRVHVWYKVKNHRGPRAVVQLFGRK